MSAIFVIGAGFSKPAGLPLGTELFTKVLALARARDLYSRTLEPDIRSYLQYLSASRGITLTEEQIDFEDFIAYLDVEHYLWLRGKDTMTSEGNESQMVIRNLIALLLFQGQQAISSSQFSVYREFARKLRPWDMVISFNYDTILETAFDELGTKYRLVPDKLSSADEFGGTAVFPDDDVVLLKVHGSIDWFDSTDFEEACERREAQGLQGPPRHPVFAHPQDCDVVPIADGPYFPQSPLRRIYRARNLQPYFDRASFLLDCPVLVSPSFHKLVYINPLRDFWYGFSRIGYAETQMAIIGFSLPPHDDYLRLPLYHLVANYQYSDKGAYPHYEPKAKLAMVDKRSTLESRTAYRDAYGFVDWSRATESYDGFSLSTLDLLFTHP